GGWSCSTGTSWITTVEPVCASSDAENEEFHEASGVPSADFGPAGGLPEQRRLTPGLTDPIFAASMKGEAARKGSGRFVRAGSSSGQGERTDETQSSQRRCGIARIVHGIPFRSGPGQSDPH